MIGANNKFFKKSGFTLVEMLVAVTIFSLAITAIAAIFVVSTKAQKRAGSLEKIDQQVKYLLEFFANSVKQAEIDYSVLPVTNPVVLSNDQYFNFLTPEDKYTSWRLISTSSIHVLQQCQRLDRYCLSIDAASDWFDLHSREVDLSIASLIVNPLVSPWQTDPETGAYLSNQQPLITLVLSAQTAALNQVPTIWQTTIASRLYKR